MTILIYVDTNIYMDHFDGRSDGLRPLGQFAFELLRRTFECEFKIIISGLIIKELMFNDCEQINELMMHLKEKNKIVKAEILEEDVQKARKISKERKTSFNDTLHSVMANRFNAEYLVTRNLKDFYDLQDLVKITVPESL